MPEDEDDQPDIYEWTDGQGEVELISTGPLDDAGDLDVDFEGSSADGSQVFFSSRIAFTDDDTDDSRDLFRRTGGQTTLVTPDAVVDAEFVQLGVFDVSADGSRIYIVTTEGLVAADEDGLEDFYELSGDDVRLLTPGTALTEFDAMRWEGRTSGGTHIYFTTPERLDDADTDVSVDVYETTADGQTILLSTGPEAEGGNFEAGFVDATSDGSHVILATEESLTEDDPDEDRDLYVRENGALRLLSDKGEEDVFLGDMTADGRRIVYDDDRDDDSDHVFVTDGGPSVELPGITGDSVRLSADGTRLLVESQDQLLPEDTDDEFDTYRMTVGLPPRNTAPPAITGTPAVGRALTCSTGTWSGDAVQYAYTWSRNGTPIAGATAATYTVAPPDGGKQLTCTVTATNETGSASATSAAVTVRGRGRPTAAAAAVRARARPVREPPDGHGRGRDADRHRRRRPAARPRRRRRAHRPGRRGLPDRRRRPGPALRRRGRRPAGRKQGHRPARRRPRRRPPDRRRRRRHPDRRQGRRPAQGRRRHRPAARRRRRRRHPRRRRRSRDRPLRRRLRRPGRGRPRGPAPRLRAQATGDLTCGVQRSSWPPSVAAGASVAPSAGAQVSDLEILSQGGDAEAEGYLVYYYDSTDDLSKVYFGTYGRLTPEDQDEFGYDIYESTGSALRLISTGPADAHENTVADDADVTADGSRVFFTTDERLVAADEDDFGTDLYARVGDETLLVSLGPVSVDPSSLVSLEGATADGSRVWFETPEALVEEDDDEVYDVYEWTGVQGEVELVSTGPTDEPEEPGVAGMGYAGSSADGAQVFFTSLVALTEDDTDDGWDVYRRAGRRDDARDARRGRRRRRGERRGRLQRLGRRLARLPRHLGGPRRRGRRRQARFLRDRRRRRHAAHPRHRVRGRGVPVHRPDRRWRADLLPDARGAGRGRHRRERRHLRALERAVHAAVERAPGRRG